MANPYYIPPVDASAAVSGLLNQMARKDEMVKQEEAVKQQQIKQDALVSEAKNLYQAGDMDAIANFAIANPDLGKSLYDAGNVRNAAAQQRMTDLSSVLVSQQDPVSYLNNYIAEGEAQGRDMTHSRKMLENSQGNPETLKSIAEFGLASNDPQAYKALKSTQPESMSDFERAKVEGKKIDQELRREENLIKREENKLKRETDNLKRQGMQQKIDASKAKIDEAKKAKQVTASNAANQAYESIGRVDDLLSNDGYMSSITGYQGRTPDFLSTTEGLEATAYLENLKDSLTIENLSAMSGPKTDKDIQVIASSASALRAGMGKEAMEKELSKIKKVYDRVAKQKIKEAGGADKVIAIESHPKYGDITEADIEKTMKSWGMTRSQVIGKLNNG